MKFIYSSISDFIFMEDQIEIADVILIPGGSNNNLTNCTSEWEFLYKNALELGVPKESILKEDKASNTFENAKFSLSVLKENKIKVNKAILVCKNFHARRAYFSYATVFPSDIKIIVSPVIDGKDIRKDNWFLDKAKIHRVMGELVKIGSYFEEHVFIDDKKVDES